MCAAQVIIPSAEKTLTKLMKYEEELRSHFNYLQQQQQQKYLLFLFIHRLSDVNRERIVTKTEEKLRVESQ